MRSVNKSFYPRPLPLTFWDRVNLDPVLLGLVLALCIIGLFILYSAANQSIPILLHQGAHFFIGFFLLFTFAQIPPHQYSRWIPIAFSLAFMLLLSVLIMGHIGKGAKRWFSLGSLHFQPSELMKLMLPMMIAWYLSDKTLPPRLKTLAVCFGLISIPSLLILKQPDLGTAIMVLSSGGFVLVLAGLQRRYIISVLGSIILLAPFFWHFMHDYQKARILTFINPERDPLGKGYHIIQSKIAIGSGGVFGKGWLEGTQSHLQFLPEHKTDFIFAVCGEEFGLMGCLTLLILLTLTAARGLYISAKAKNTFSRLLAGSLSLTFFLSFIINIGMVIGIFPVVGIPLPLISYGGTSVVITLASFGMIMSINGHRQLLAN